MHLTEDGKKILRDLMDKKMRMLLDWTDFVEDAGVPDHALNGYLRCERNDVPDSHLAGIAYALKISRAELLDKLQGNTPENA